ncbi:uncharacterized protein LOC132042220, partial [Lycium ferocissimum]|uniref:uncharacterized protein LOC132042220 n=1 Tax=Lycium ferocissimum TaxID=112874 RepID=UPI002814DFD7
MGQTEPVKRKKVYYSFRSRERSLAAQSRQESYVDNRRQRLGFQIGDWVIRRASATEGVMRFGKKGKLSSRHVGPYQVVHKVGEVAYKLDLPFDLGAVHPVSTCLCFANGLVTASEMRLIGDIQATEELAYEEQPIAILDRQ